MANILISGGSGLIGTRLTELLLASGHKVRHLAREKRESAVEIFTWDIEKQQVEQGALNGIDAIVHLAGASIAGGRWTDKRKKEILDSRIKSTHLLFNELKKRDHVVKTFLCASAIGYYGTTCTDKPLTEDSSPGNDFLSQVVKSWEREADKIETLGIRVVKVRTGLVLSKHGGALAPMALQVKLCVGAPLGSGDQIMSWVHIDDHCRFFMQALENTAWRGNYNSVAPHPVTNKQLTFAIAKILKRPILLPHIPGMVLKLILGEMAVLVLAGCNISGKKAERMGFVFKFHRLESALENVLITQGSLE